MHNRFPLPDPDFKPLAPFWAGALDNKLMLPCDPKSERIVWYPKGEPEQYEWREVSGKARLFSWVILHHAFLPQYKSALPFITALVSIDEDPEIRLATRLLDIENPNQLEADMALEVVFEDLSYDGVIDADGNPIKVKAPFFKPV